MNLPISPLNRFFAEKTLGKEATEPKTRFLMGLMESARQGDLCWKPEPEIARIADSLPSKALTEGTDESLFPPTPVIRQRDPRGERFYLQRNWVYETYLLQQIKRLRSLKPSPLFDPARFEEGVRREIERGKLLPQQAEALRSAFKTSFSLICGGPGTGKTYISGGFIRLLSESFKREEKKTFKVRIAAPTGKAAARLQSAFSAQGEIDPVLDLEATTLHRLLHLRPEHSKLFSGNRIHADLVMVDEASMLDASLFAHLLEAVGDDTKLVLIGDPDQLPPVDAGSLFAEMADLFAFRLDRCVRTDVPELQNFAQAVNRGDLALVEEILRTPNQSLKRHFWSFDSQWIAEIVQRFPPLLFSEKPDPKQLLKEMDAFRIVGALRQGPFGIDAINCALLQEMERRIRPGQWWAFPLLVKVNAPHQDLYNGSGGILIGQSGSRIQWQEGRAYFPDSERGIRICPSPPPFEPAFCLSIHKSQGSEFEKVLALFPPGSETFGREALYTAATRSKKQLELVIEEETLRMMLSERGRKASGLTDRLAE